jgi:hypothetical protein
LIHSIFHIKKIFFLATIFCLMSFKSGQYSSNLNVASLDTCSSELEFFYISSIRFNEHVNSLYQDIFEKQKKPSKKVFELALKGYVNMMAKDLLLQKNILTIIDYSLSANLKRMWVIDIKQKKILFHELVAHGRNSGEEIATKFSNNNESFQSSIGFFITGEIYEGKHAESLKLHGLEKRFNDKAFDRGIVIHGAEYVSEEFIKTNQRLGRSLGCPAVSNSVNVTLINTIKDGTCLFAYYPQKKYLKQSELLNVDIIVGIPALK